MDPNKENNKLNNVLFGDSSLSLSSPESFSELTKFKFKILQIEKLSDDRIKLDIKSLIESLFSTLIFPICAVLIFIIGIVSKATPVLLAGSSLMIIVGLFFLALKYTDNYYIIDLTSRSLIYHFEFFHIKKETKISGIDEAIGLGVSGVIRKDFFSGWSCRYYLVFITDRGKLIRLSDESRELKQLNLEAKKIADFLNLNFYPGYSQKEIVVYETDEGYKVEHGIITVIRG